MKAVWWTIAAVAIISGCNRIDASEGETPGLISAGANKVDSILPPEETMRRFTAGIPRVTRLSGGAESRDSLVARFMSALEKNDTTSLATMLVLRGEYGFLYYPTSPYARKPYELAPDLAWMLNDQNSAKGLSRLLARLGGHRLQVKSYSCGVDVREGDNRFWRNCRVVYRDSGKAADENRTLFGAIMERAGHFKFLSYANDF